MYKHGVYGDRVASNIKISKSLGTIPMYFGTAPIFRKIKTNVNKAVLVSSLEEAINLFGYSEKDDFEKYTLSGCIYAHFNNKIKPIGPIILVNVLSTKTKTSSTSKTVNLINGIGYIEDDLELSTIDISTMTLDTDFTAVYEDNKVKLTVTKDNAGNSVDVTYKQIDPEITDTEIVTGLKTVDTVYQELNVVPNILVVPGFSTSQVESALLNKSSFIDGNMEGIVVLDIESKTSDTIDKAIQFKKTNNFVSNKEKLCWPRFKVGDKIIYASIVYAVTMQITDTLNEGVPYESPSNKEIDITGMVIGADSTLKSIKFNRTEANRLNEKGISTALFSGGRWVVWGPHMANYEYGVTNKPDEIFDSTVRTNIYLNNDFAIRNVDIVDKPLSRNDIDSILNTEQARLNSLVADGKLLYAKIDFLPSQNPDNDIMTGDFVFNSSVTNTPPAKSLTNKVQYVSDGLRKLTGGNE